MQVLKRSVQRSFPTPCTVWREMMSTKHVLVDAFAVDRRAFTGNPASIIFCQGSETWMQNMAMELNSPVTAFVASLCPEKGKFSIRWFTPKQEITICGHATLAAAYALFNSTLDKKRIITFNSKYCGDIVCSLSSDGCVQTNFPSDIPLPISLPKESIRILLTALSIDADDILFLGSSSADLIVELRRVAFSRISQVVDYNLLKSLGYRGVLVTCIGKRRVMPNEIDTYHCVSCGGHPFMNSAAYDYMLRAFFPSMGLMEDVATGSAQCALVPYYYRKFGMHASSNCDDISKTEYLTAYQASRRSGLLRVTMLCDTAMKSQRVVIAGNCVTILTSLLEPV